MSSGVEQQLHAMIREIAPAPVSEITSASRLEDDLGFDSLALVELAVQLEQQFKLPPLSEEEALDITTVGDIEALLKGALG